MFCGHERVGDQLPNNLDDATATANLHGAALAPTVDTSLATVATDGVRPSSDDSCSEK